MTGCCSLFVLYNRAEGDEEKVKRGTRKHKMSIARDVTRQNEKEGKNKCCNLSCLRGLFRTHFGNVQYERAFLLQ